MMLLNFLRYAFIVVFAAISTEAFAEGDEPAAAPKNVQATSIAQAEEIGSDGAFTYSVPLKIPEFRGLEPNLGLRYNSQDLSRVGWDAIIGLGWKLKGVSTIERVSEGRGAPFYDLSRDIFLLDGQELLACYDSGHANWPSGWGYPDDFRTNRASASCTAGGNMTTLHEKYLKVVRSGNDTSASSVFYVYKKDGTRYKYETLGAVGGWPSSLTGDEYKLAFRRQWLLTEIRDAQATPNVVRFEYYIGSNLNAFVPRPKKITYAGYEVQFHYETNPEPAIGFATGTVRFGKQFQRLSSVTVWDGAKKIRAYQLGFDAGAGQTGASRLSQVQEWGNDFVHDGTDVTGGTADLSKWSFGYTGDSFALARRAYSRNFNSVTSAADVTNDGIADLIRLSYRRKWQEKIRPEEWVEHDETVPGARIKFDTSLGDSYVGPDNSMATEVAQPEPQRIPWNGTDTADNYLQDGEYGAQKLIAISRPDPDTRKTYFIFQRCKNVEEIEGDRAGYRVVESYTTCEAASREVGAAAGSDKSVVSYNLATAAPLAKRAVLQGNFDREDHQELILNGRVYRLVDGVIQRVGALDGTIAAHFDNRSSSNYIMSPYGIPSSNGRYIHAGPYALDLDGDGIDEILGTERVLRVGASGFASQALSGNQVVMVHSDATNCRQIAVPCDIEFGDINGDGLSDAVRIERYSDDVRVSVALNRGGRFASWNEDWDDDFDSNAEFDFNYVQGASANSDYLRSIRNQVVDVNGDGLADLITHDGFQDFSSPHRVDDIVMASRSAHVFLSNGAKFVSPAGTASDKIENFLGLGDFNGDGLLEAFSGKDSASLYYQTNDIPNLLTSVTDPMGGQTQVAYTSSKQMSSTNDVPGVQQLVASITRKSGFSGQDRKTTYTYVNGRYDFKLRRLLGFQTVTATLPRLANESANTVVTTIFDNSHYGRKGQVASRIRSYDGSTTYSLVTNNWASVGEGDRPYRKEKTRTVSKENWGGSLIAKTTNYLQDIYGNMTYLTELGFGGASGSNVDDVRTYTDYGAPNTALYIVDKPRYKLIVNGVDTFNPSKWLRREFYFYDGNTSWGDLATSGNLTKLVLWSGDEANTGVGRTEAQYDYDDYGNLRWEKGGRGNKTDYAYDTTKNLFRISTTNAKGHVSWTGWDYVCQAPVAETDPNGLTTSYTYDRHCRQATVMAPNGHRVTKAYVNTGTATAQFVQTLELSPGPGNFRARQYFNGFGEVYRETSSGATEEQADFSVTLRGFDPRGNLSWESIPLSWSVGGTATSVASKQKTTFTYDPADRQTKVTLPDDNYRRIEYSKLNTFTARNGQSTTWPRTIHWDENCNANIDPCGRVDWMYNAQGKKFRKVIWDSDATDYGSTTSSTGRAYNYTYDNMGRLVEVTDPLGATWSYSYNSYGDRVAANDPALGNWTMEYDAAHNLSKQTDAKGQVITFGYDELNRVDFKIVDTNETGTSADHTVTRNWYDTVRSGYYNIGKLTITRVGEKGVSYSNLDISNDVETAYYYYGNDGLLAKEQRNVNVRVYTFETGYYSNGQVKYQTLPNTPGSADVGQTPDFTYDTASRLTGFGTYITDATYDVWGRPTRVYYGNDTHEANSYSNTRGWTNTVSLFRTSNNDLLDRTIYDNSNNFDRDPTGRVTKQDTYSSLGDLVFTYDYAGRLLTSTGWNGNSNFNQTFSYDKSGSMRSNSRVGTYNYNSKKHAPKSVTNGGTTENFTYDANGNMLTGLGGKVMTYDGENRPLSVTVNGVRTEYIYGADGKRLKRIDNAGTANETETLYMGVVEIRRFGQGSAENIYALPHPNIRLKNGGNPVYFFRNQLDSVTSEWISGTSNRDRINYRPFGEFTEAAVAADREDRRFIGECYDRAAGLSYLNARYYDPKLSMFIPLDIKVVKRAANISVAPEAAGSVAQ